MNYIAVEEGVDGGHILSDEVLNFLERSNGQNSEEMVLYMNALSGTEHSRCIRLRALIKDQVILQLLGSSSSNTFISEVASTRIQCVTQETNPVSVKVANGQTLTCKRKVVQ